MEICSFKRDAVSVFAWSGLARANGASTRVAAHMETCPIRTICRMSSGNACRSESRLETQLLSFPIKAAILPRDNWCLS